MPIAASEADLTAIFDELREQTDRGAAIIGAAILESGLTDLIERILTSRVRDRIFSYEANGPLSRLRPKLISVLL